MFSLLGFIARLRAAGRSRVNSFRNAACKYLIFQADQDLLHIKFTSQSVFSLSIRRRPGWNGRNYGMTIQKLERTEEPCKA